MKKYLTLSLLVLLFACRKETKENDSRLSRDKENNSVTLAQALQMQGNLSTMSIPGFNTVTKTIDLLSIPANAFCSGSEFSVSGFPFIPTHGLITTNQVDDFIWMSAGKDDDEGKTYGSGFVIRYDFKKGKTYIISATVNSKSSKLEMLATNQFSQNNLCDFTSPDVQSGGTNPKATFEPNSNVKTFTFEFTPESCYSYVWFNAVGKFQQTGTMRVGLGRYIKIEETSLIEIAGPDLSCANTEGDFTLTVGGYTISDSFNWSVTGDLQIIGSNVGNTVKIRRNGTFGGEVSISSGSCSAIATHTFSSASIAFKPYRLCTYDDSFTMEAIYIPGVTGISWQGTDFNNVPFDLGSSGWTVEVPPNTRNVRFTATGACGQVTKSTRVALTDCL